MATYTGTSGNDSWTVVNPGTFSLDGLGGVDTLYLGTSLRSSYTITQATDGSVHVDSVSGASAALHATLYNMEKLVFNSGHDILDLTTYFGDTTPPTVVFTDNTAGTATGTITYNLQFSETITGLVASDFSVTNGAVTSVAGSGASYTVLVTPIANTEGSLGLTLNAGSVQDLAGNPNAASSAAAQAIDTLAPVVSAFAPADEATGVGISSNIVVTFSEAIQRGIGTISLKTADGTVVEAYDAATSANLAVSGNTLAIDPSTYLNTGTAYKVEFAPGTIKDLAGNGYAGTTAYNFSTVPSGDTTAPTVVNSNPTDDSFGVAVSSDLTLNFSEPVAKGAGTITLKTIDGTVVETFDAASSANLSVSGNTLTVNPTGNLAYGTGYVLDIAAGAIQDLSGNPYAGSSDYNFTTTWVNQADPASAYIELAQKLFLAYFGRAADPGALANMSQQLAAAHAPTTVLAFKDSYDTNPAVKAIIDTLGLSNESHNLYAGASTADMVTAIFHYMFNRDPAPAGLAFWVNGIDNDPNLNLAKAALAIMQGSENYPLADGLTVAKKVAVAENFTGELNTPTEVSAYAGAAAAAAVRSMLGGVDKTTDTGAYETHVLSTVDQLVAAHPVTVAAYQTVDAAVAAPAALAVDVPLVGVIDYPVF